MRWWVCGEDASLEKKHRDRAQEAKRMASKKNEWKKKLRKKAKVTEGGK